MNSQILVQILAVSVVAILVFYGLFTKFWRHRSGQSLFGVIAALGLLLSYVMFIRNFGQPERTIIANVLMSLLIIAAWYMLAVMVKERFFREDNNLYQKIRDKLRKEK